MRATSFLIASMALTVTAGMRPAIAQAQDGASGPPATAAAEVGRTARPTIAVAPFDTDRTGWAPPPHFGETVSDLLATRLVDLGAYRVFDRALLPENGQPGRRVSFDEIRELASQAGVDYVVLGAVTRFGNEKNHSRGGLLGIPFLGGLGKNTQESTVGLTVRVVDVKTGEIVSTSTSLGAASKSNRTVGAAGLVHGVPVGGLFTSGGTGALDRLVGNALVDAVENAAASLTKAAGKMSGGSGIPLPAPRVFDF